MIFGTKIFQIKCKPLKIQDFLRFSARNLGLHLEHIFKINKYKEQNITLLKKTQILKLLEVIETVQIVPKNLLGCMGWGIKVLMLRPQGIKKMKIKDVLNSPKMKCCKKNIFGNVLKNNLLEENLKVLCYNYLWFTLWWHTSRMNYEKCDQ